MKREKVRKRKKAKRLSLRSLVFEPTLTIEQLEREVQQIVNKNLGGE